LPWAGHEAARRKADDDRRAEIEHRLLAGQSPATVGELTGVAVAVVEAYIAIYFDVPDRLGARDWVLTEVLGGPLGVQGPLTDRQLLAWAAYWGGAYVLQVLIDEVRDPDADAPRPTLAKMRWLVEFEQAKLGTAAFAELIDEGERRFGSHERLAFLRAVNRWTMQANGAHSPLAPAEADRGAEPARRRGALMGGRRDG